MSLILDLSPALEAQLLEAAAQEGSNVSELLGRFLTLFVQVRQEKLRHRQALPALILSDVQKQPGVNVGFPRLVLVSSPVRAERRG
jgi:hypothetical protein